MPKDMSRVTNLCLIWTAFALCGCASHAPQPNGNLGGCIHNHELPPLTLTPAQEQLLASAPKSPRTALDYYMLLPKSYFSIMPDSRERRVSYIDLESLSNDYLHASRWFECDGGGFEVVLRLYKSSSGTIVGLLTNESTTIYKGKPDEGAPSITVRKPSFWKYTAGAWVPQSGTLLPDLGSSEILDRYYHHYKAHLIEPDQPKYIWLAYTPLPTTTDIHVTGRGNFMKPSKEYIWKRYSWTGKRFIPR